MKSALISPLLAGLLLLTGCAQPAAQAGGGGGGTIDAINHTKWAINHFSVNGQSGIDIIGPFQGAWRAVCWPSSACGRRDCCSPLPSITVRLLR
ncbi:DUF3304 domain-containing protein [Klebsiella pneumoniae]